MLTQREKDFIRYWETNRLPRKKIVRQFLVGIPVGLLFVIPIVINFASGWYKRAQMEANSQDFNPLVLLVALLLIVAFTAIFYQQHQWDQYEQRYRELLVRQDHDTSEEPQTATQSTPGEPQTAIQSAPGEPETAAQPASGEPQPPPQPTPGADPQEKAGEN